MWPWEWLSNMMSNMMCKWYPQIVTSQGQASLRDSLGGIRVRKHHQLIATMLSHQPQLLITSLFFICRLGWASQYPHWAIDCSHQLVSAGSYWFSRTSAVMIYSMTCVRACLRGKAYSLMDVILSTWCLYTYSLHMFWLRNRGGHCPSHLQASMLPRSVNCRSSPCLAFQTWVAAEYLFHTLQGASLVPSLNEAEPIVWIIVHYLCAEHNVKIFMKSIRPKHPVT